MAIGGGITQIPPAAVAAVTDETPSFQVIEEDLAFILRQIQISEAHAAGGDLLCAEVTDTSGKCVPSANVPAGLRTVDGSFNNLLAGQQDFGAADRVFPKLLPQEWRQADPALTAAGAPPAGDTSMCADPNATCYSMSQPGHFVYDSDPRTISNLIVDQTENNPAAVDAMLAIDPAATPDANGNVSIPNTTADEALSAPFNTWMAFFGQFFDHGLDMVNKGGNGTIIVPLQPDDPLYIEGSSTNFMTLTRATRFNDSGQVDPAGVSHNNQTTPYVDQNQTYTSHPSHQVFLREYVSDANGRPIDTGQLLDGTLPNGTKGGLVTWNDVKKQASEVLGIDLTDADVLDVPLLRTDDYGNFIPDPATGMPLLVTMDENGAPLNVAGNLDNPISTVDAAGTAHAFLDDIAHGAAPQVDADGNVIIGGYDNVMLGEHFATGDGRGNENVGLTAVHHVFHAEHNRMVGEIDTILNKPENIELKNAYMGLDNSWPTKRASDALPGTEADDWSYGQRLFQAARFVTEMQYQHLVFEEFARTAQPSIDAVVFNENGYDGNIDAAIVAEFAHVVYRFGHSMLTQNIDRAGPATEPIPLLDGFLNPRAYDNDGTLSPQDAAGAIVNGTTDQRGSQIDEFVIDALRNNLLGLPLDLATINLVRARDAGVPSLQTARETLFNASGDTVLRPYESWVDFGLNLKTGDNFGRTGSNASLINFVAAYGTHPSVVNAVTMEEKRNAAALIVNGSPEPTPLSTRYGGLDRAETAALFSRGSFAPGVPVAYITTSADFPDALAGGPAAAIAGGPILLTGPTQLPRSTAAELARLQPQSIVVLGGPGVVNNAIFTTLEAFTDGYVTRVSGANRIQTSVAVSETTFEANRGGVAYISTGLDFPDALAGAAAAGSARSAEGVGPVLLINPGALAPAVRTELIRLQPDKIIVLGGPGVVTNNVVTALNQYTSGEVIRLAGPDRISTAVEISKHSWPNGAEVAYIATGTNFPDALSAAPVAGMNNGPLLLVPSSGLPQIVADELARLGVKHAVILGGDSVTSVAIQAEIEGVIDPNIIAPDDRVAFMNNVGPWEGMETGLGEVDMWVGGLAEVLNPFGGMLGSTFNVIFERQLENLQFGDRFYYLFRNQGQQLFAALEANSFSDLIKRNTTADKLPATIFTVADLEFDLENLPSPLPAGMSQMQDGTLRWSGEEHIEMHGTDSDDRMRGAQGDDSIFGSAGNDRIEGGDGNDALLGGEGDDILTDSFGDDNLKGGNGNDALDGGPGDNLMLGSHGDDFFSSGGDTPNLIFAGTGDDVTQGGAGRMTVFGGEGDDWVQGGHHGDLLQGDNGNQYQNDVTGGNDVVIGGAGNDDIEGEGGDDILVGQQFGVDRYLGNLGFDWLSYYGQRGPVTADFTFNRMTAPAVTATRARYDQIEALSGGAGNDTLAGSFRTPDEYVDTDAVLEKATEDTLDLVTGLEAMLRPGGAHEDYALRFMDNPLAADSDGVSNIIIGGAGSDRIEGREGDDFLDGDAYLRVQLVHEPSGQRFDSAADLKQAIFAGEINPGDIGIERAIEMDDPNSGAVDTAIYNGPYSEYQITAMGDGYYKVSHSGAVEVEESTGADIIRNFEQVQFSDGCYNVASGLACEAEGTVVLQFDGPGLVEGDEVVATVLALDGTSPFDMTGVTNLRFTWWAGEGSANDISEWEQIATTSADPGNPTVSRLVMDDLAADQVVRVIVNYTHTVPPATPGGPASVLGKAIVSEPTGVTVTNVNDLPTAVTIVTAGGLTVGAGAIASPFTDGDGLAEAAESGIVYLWQRSASGAFDDAVEVQSGASTAYQFTAADVGAWIRVIVRYTDDLGTAEENISAPVGPVEAVPVVVEPPVVVPLAPPAPPAEGSTSPPAEAPPSPPASTPPGGPPPVGTGSEVVTP